MLYGKNVYLKRLAQLFCWLFFVIAYIEGYMIAKLIMEPVQIEVHRLHVVTIRHDMSATEFVHWKEKNML